MTKNSRKCSKMSCGWAVGLENKCGGSKMRSGTRERLTIDVNIDAPTNDLPSEKHTQTHTQACDGVTDS